MSGAVHAAFVIVFLNCFWRAMASSSLDSGPFGSGRGIGRICVSPVRFGAAAAAAGSMPRFAARAAASGEIWWFTTAPPLSGSIADDAVVDGVEPAVVVAARSVGVAPGSAGVGVPAADVVAPDVVGAFVDGVDDDDVARVIP
jgi:hypothetical protein